MDVKLDLGVRGSLKLKLAEDERGRPLFAVTIPNVSDRSVQLGDATYAARIPGVSAAFVQPDLSGGVGRRTQVPSQAGEAFTQYHYADLVDASIPGQIGPGPASTTINKLTNGGSLSGSFELGGNLYLVCGREIAAYDATAGTISEAEDLGAGVSGFGGATFVRLGTESSDQTSTGTGATDTLNGPKALIAQKITPTATRDLGRVDLQLLRTDVVAVQIVTLTGTPAGGTFTLAYGGSVTGNLAYNISAADMQTALRALTGLGSVTVTAGNSSWVVTFAGVVGPALSLAADGTALTGGTLPSVAVTAARVGATVAGNVELAVMMDLNGRPSMEDVVVAELDAAGLSTSAATAVFRFDDADTFLQEAGVAYWLVLRASGSTATATVGWTRTTSGTQNGLTSADLGNSWTAAYNHYFTTYSKALTATAFVGKAQGAKFLYTSDGATFTADSVYEGKHFVVYGGLLIRDARAGSNGAIAWSSDGLNWSEPLVVGDPTIQVTAILALPACVLVVKEDSIWAVDPAAETVQPYPIHTAGGKSTTNGVGACVWLGTAYIPFDGRLLALSGDVTNGFSVKPSIGPDSRDEWDAPFGTGRIVAVAGDRHCLYAAMSTSGSYELFKSYEPLAAKWHGSILDLGTSTTFTHMKVFDRGGANSPLLFYATTSDNLGRVTLPRTRVPWADTSYTVTTTTGKLYHPWANGNAHINQKAWLKVSETFAQEAAGGYVDEFFDDLDGNNWRAVPASRRYETDDCDMPLGLVSKVLKRYTRITAASATAYPLLLASGLSYAVRPPEKLRQFNFTLDAEDSASGRELGALLGTTGEEVTAELFLAATALGTLMLTDLQGKEHRVLIQNATDTAIERRGGQTKRGAVEVVGVSQ